MVTVSALSSAGLEQGTSNSQVVGSSPTGRAIFHKPDFKLLSDYEPYVCWTHYVEFNANLLHNVTAPLKHRGCLYEFVYDPKHKSCVGLIWAPFRDNRTNKISVLPQQILYSCYVIMSLPGRDCHADIHKHRFLSDTPKGEKADQYFQKKIKRLIDLR